MVIVEQDTHFTAKLDYYFLRLQTVTANPALLRGMSHTTQMLRANQLVIKIHIHIVIVRLKRLHTTVS